MKHDTNNNVEVISRLIEQIYQTHGGLPKGLHLQQDNTCMECKNQKLLKWAIKLVALGVFKWITLSYLTTAHPRRLGRHVWAANCQACPDHI